MDGSPWSQQGTQPLSRSTVSGVHRFQVASGAARQTAALLRLTSTRKLMTTSPARGGGEEDEADRWRTKHVDTKYEYPSCLAPILKLLPEAPCLVPPPRLFFQVNKTSIVKTPIARRPRRVGAFTASAAYYCVPADCYTISSGSHFTV
ncbi:hypothetical protein G7046_g5525 [Stylonectria norvegica]|nr:hypothetical protein G7046_g5525 [Stylonectria norvegica]